MPNLEVRPLSAADEGEWCRLWMGYLEYYETTLSEEIYYSSFSRMLSSEQNEFNGLIALLDGKPIGLAHFLFHRHGWKVENVCYLQDLFVDKGLRGTGAGRALIEEVYRQADAAGCPSVYWQTEHFNEVGRRLYDRVGKQTPFIVYNRS